MNISTSHASRTKQFGNRMIKGITEFDMKIRLILIDFILLLVVEMKFGMLASLMLASAVRDHIHCLLPVFRLMLIDFSC